MRKDKFALIVIFLLFVQSLMIIPSVEAKSVLQVEVLSSGTRSTSGYHNFSETIQILTDLEKTYPNIVKMYDLSKRYPYFNGTPKTTVKNNTIWAIRISDNPGVDENDEPRILYVGLHHAREWITVEVSLYMAKYLTSNYNSNSTVKKMVNDNEIWILPILNPDGYIYSHSRDDINRSSGSGGWRKNLKETNGVPGFQNNGGSTGDGVDLNRNYGYMWGYDNVGSEPFPNGTLYRGPSAFSEVETQIMRDFASDRIFDIAVSFHSYSEIIIFPWGYIDKDTEHHKLFMELGEEMGKYNGYPHGNPKSGLIYNVNGEFADWMYGTHKTLAFTFELGQVFIPPPALVQNMCKQNAEAAFIAAKYVANPFVLFESRIEAVVKNTLGEPLEGVEIATNYVEYDLKAYTDGAGKSVMRLPDGTYNITILKSGYETRELTGINIAKDAKRTLNLILRDVLPPEVKEVKASSDLGSSESNFVFNAGEELVIVVRDKANETDLTGYVTINSISQDYLSKQLPLSYSLSLNGYYAYWNTYGLNQSDDYNIEANLTDYDGNSDTDGSNDAGPDLIITLLDITPPVISAVRSSVGSDIGGVYETNSIVRIEVYETQHEIGLLGTVQITDMDNGYSSGVQELSFASELNYYYWDWDTTGLLPSSKYYIETSLADKWGNIDDDGLETYPDKIIVLVDTSSPEITSLDSFVGNDFDEDYEQGSNVTLIVREYENESGLSGRIKLYSPDLGSSSTMELNLEFDLDNNYYYAHWDTTHATPYVDYYIDAKLIDDYDNADLDGSNNFGPDLIITITDTRSPIVVDVYAVTDSILETSDPSIKDSILNEKKSTFEIGDDVRVIIEPAEFELNLIGTVNITSGKNKYDSEPLQIQFDSKFEHHFVIWETRNLEPSNDYVVEVSLSDSYGNFDIDGLFSDKPDLILSLDDTIPPSVYKISVTYPNNNVIELERVELGTTVNILIFVEGYEEDLIGKIRITSVLNSYDSGEIKTHYNTSLQSYLFAWNTSSLKIGEDYELEAIFSDKYGNLDLDGWKLGPDVLLILEDTIMPDPIKDLIGFEDLEQKGVVKLGWSQVELNASVKIYRSEKDFSSIDEATLIATVSFDNNFYRDDVGTNGRTYFYAVLVVDENGNLNNSLTVGNKESVTVSKIEPRRS
jgi:hypothetical protein